MGQERPISPGGDIGWARPTSTADDQRRGGDQLGALVGICWCCSMMVSRFLRQAIGPHSRQPWEQNRRRRDALGTGSGGSKRSGDKWVEQGELEGRRPREALSARGSGERRDGRQGLRRQNMFEGGAASIAMSKPVWG